MSEFNDVPELKTSKYNSAVDQIYRFGQIWRDAYSAAKNGNYSLWNTILDGAWRELAGDLVQKYGINSDNYKLKYQQLNELNKNLLSVYPLTTGVIVDGFDETPMTDKMRISKQYIYLNRKEIFLRVLLNELGKGTAWDDTEDDDFG